MAETEEKHSGQVASTTMVTVLKGNRVKLPKSCYSNPPPTVFSYRGTTSMSSLTRGHFPSWSYDRIQESNVRGCD